MEERVTLESEAEAIKGISKILKPLNTASQKNVVGYVFKHLGLEAQLGYSGDVDSPNSVPFDSSLTSQNKLPKETVNRIKDIRSFADEKNPRTVIEKIILVGFYLSEIAQNDEKTEQFDSKHIKTYFKQAGFKLPINISTELARAKDAGYIEIAQKGKPYKYKLNPVGYNLIAHSLPGKSNSRKTNPQRTTKKSDKKKA